MMKIAVIGAGAVGSLFGGLLSKAGFHVTLIDKYPERAALLSASGLAMEGLSGDLQIPIQATTDASTLGSADLVLVCVKAYDSGQAITQHKAVVGPATTVLTLQNGLGNVEQIAAVVGHDKLVGGTTAQGGYMIEPGRFRHAGNGPTHIGEISGKRTERIQIIADAFNQAGIATSLSDNIDELIWTKLVVNVGINALTALLRVNNGLTSSVEAARAVQKTAVDEALAVAQAAGIKLDAVQVAQKVVDVARVTELNVSSMLTDVKKERRTEIDFINGAVCVEGDKVKVPTPVNQTLTDLVKAIEQTHGRRVR